METRKCQYSHCKEGGTVNLSEAVFEKGKYYHFQCYEKKNIKLKVFEKFCEYVTNEEDGKFIRKKISDYIDKEGFSPNYVYFTMCYIIRENIPLKSIFGLKLVMNQARVKKAYEVVLNKQKSVKIKSEENNYVFTKEEKGGWGDLIG